MIKYIYGNRKKEELIDVCGKILKHFLQSLNKK